jgi:hypothetical protein
VSPRRAAAQFPLAGASNNSYIPTTPSQEIHMQANLRTTARLLAVTAIAMAASAHASMLPDAVQKEWPANPARHVVTIKRVSNNDAEAKMIAAAEAAVPAKADVLAAAQQDPAPAGEKLWWHDEQLGIKIPFAITGEAVAYYSALIDGYGKQALTRYIEPGSEMTYQASVAAAESVELDGKTFKNVFVVSMSLMFSENFAATSTEGMMFSKERKVVLDKDGKVLHVSGDGPTQAAIVAI